MWQVLIGYDGGLSDLTERLILFLVLGPWLAFLELSGKRSSPKTIIIRILIIAWFTDRLLADHALWLPVGLAGAGLWSLALIRHISKGKKGSISGFLWCVALLISASILFHYKHLMLLRWVGLAAVFMSIYADRILMPAHGEDHLENQSCRADIIKPILLCFVVATLIYLDWNGLTRHRFFIIITGGAIGWLGIRFYCWRLLESHPERKRALIRLVSSISSLLLGLFIAIIPVELYFRYIYDASDAIGDLRTARHWESRHVVTNSWGYRDIEFEPLERFYNQPRILVIGDSFAFGYGIDNYEDMLGAQLEQELSTRSDPAPKVFTVSKPGSNTQYQTRMFLLDGQRLKPHVVVLAYCLNDIEISTPDFPRRGWAFEMWQPLMRASDFFEFFIWHFYRSFVLGRYFEPDSVFAPYLDDAELSRHTQELKTLFSAIKEAGAQPVAVLYPYMIAPTQNGPQRKAIDRLMKVMAELGSPVLDVSQIVDISERRYHANPFDPHPSPELHGAVVPKLANLVSEALYRTGTTAPAGQLQPKSQPGK